MKRITTGLAALMLLTTPVFAGGSETAETSLLTVIFIVFGALIIVAQLIPGTVLFYSMVKGLLGKEAKKTTAAADAKTT